MYLGMGETEILVCSTPPSNCMTEIALKTSQCLQNTMLKTLIYSSPLNVRMEKLKPRTAEEHAQSHMLREGRGFMC